MKPLVIGVGNAYRGDDAAGLQAARQLAQLPGVRVLEQCGEGAALIESWQDAGTVILIDAVHSGGDPGTIHRFDARAQQLPVHFFHYSTHAFSVAEAIEVARALDQLPPRLIVYGIEGATFEAGQSLSTAVEEAMPTVVEKILAEIKTAYA